MKLLQTRVSNEGGNSVLVETEPTISKFASVPAATGNYFTVMPAIKMIQSFWSKPLDNLLSLKYNGGWLERKYYYMSLCFSCLLLKRYYENVELVTDTEGKRILIGELGLPYTSTRVDLDGLDPWHSDLGLTAKLVSLQYQCEPAIYVESDLFLCDRLSPQVESGAVVAYGEIGFAPGELNEFMGFVRKNIPAGNLSAGGSLLGANAGFDLGLLGGNDIRLVSDFAKESLAFLAASGDVIRRDIMSAVKDVSKYWHDPHPFDIAIAMLESLLLASFAGRHPGKVNIAYSRSATNRGKTANFLEMSVKLAHLRIQHNRKRNIDLCVQMEYKFREQFPDYYDRVIDRMMEGNI